MNHRHFSFLRIILPALMILGLMTSVFQPQFDVAAATLTITPNAWNVIGLDSNNPAVGPYRFPVGAKICTSVATTNVVVNFVWDDTTNASDIYLRVGSLSSITIPSIAPGAANCKDAYFEVEVNRSASPAPYNKARKYHITATDSSGTVSTIQPRELYVEHLISQNRNAVTDVKYGTTLGSVVPVAAGGTMTLMVGNTYYIQLFGGTATQGYNQFEDFINFPNTIFQMLSVSTTYSADSNTAHVPNPNPGLYADACTWDNDPNSPTYRSCIGGDDKAGGSNVVTTYQVKIISGGGTSQTLNTLLYDFSGSSYHYNADYSTGSRIASIIDPSVTTISKSFSPKAIPPGGTSVMTIKLANPTTLASTGVGFTDTFPTSLTLANTTITNTCGGSLTDAADGGLNVGDTGIKLSGGTLSANSSCTIIVNVTAPAGTYLNTTGHLFINDTIDTGNFGSDTLTASSAPACIPGQTLARWAMPAGASAPPDTAGGVPTTNNTGFTATAFHFPAASQSAVSGSGSPDTTSDDASWETWGYRNAGGYVEFVVDTRYYSSVQMGFMVYTDSSTGPTTLTVTYVGNGSGTAVTYTGATLTAGAWNTKTIDLSALASTTGATTIRISGTGANNDNSGADAYFNDVSFTGCSIAAPAPTIAKSFSPNPIIKGSTSTLGFTLNNTAAGNRALSGVAFTDVLPAGLSIANSSASQCGGTLTTSAATRTIALTGGSLAAGGSCTFNVTVTGTTEGQYDNVTGFVSSTQSGTSTNYATASLTVIAPPVLAKSFSPASIFTGNPSTLTFTITNPNTNTVLSGIGFTDTLPAGLTVDTSGPVAGCGGSLTTTAPSTIVLTGGSLPANNNCSFDLFVTGGTAGTKNNTTTAVTSTEGGNGNTASASIVVTDQTASLDLTKQVSATGSDPWSTFIGVAGGSDVYYRFKVYNSGDLPFTAISVSDPTLAGTLVDPATCNWAALLPLAPGETAYCIKGPIAASGTPGSYPNTATAHGTYASGNKDSSTSTATYATPGLTITKNATESFFVAAGNILHYSYAVTNTGYVPLLGPVTVTDDKSADESCPAVNTVGDLDDYLDRNEALNCTATYTVIGGDVTAGSVTNNAFATAGGITSNTATKTVSTAAELTVTKTNNVSGIAAIGSAFTWTLTMSNGGNTAATFANGQTILSDPLPAGPTYGTPIAGSFTNITGSANISCSVTTGTLSCIANGGSVTIGTGGSFVASFTVTPASSGSLANTVTVDPNNNITEMDEANNTSSNTVTVLNPPSIAKSFSPNAINVGGTSTLSFTITNPNAGASLTGVAFADNLPVGLQVATTPNVTTLGCGSPTFAPIAGDNSLSFSNGTILPSASCTVSIAVTPTTAGIKNNTTGAVSSTNGGTGNTASSALTVTAPDFSTVKTDGSPTYFPGAAITYTITVSNVGNGASDGIVTDNFPASLTAVTWTCTGTGLATCSATGSGNINDSVSIPAGASVTYTINATILGSATGDLANTATATLSGATDPTPGNNSSTDTDTFASAPGITLTKSPTLDDTVVAPSGVANAGDQITYTFSVQNIGNVTITNINVTDPLLPTLTCTIASLAPGATSSCLPANNVYTLQQADIDAGSRSNTATATGKDPGDNDVTDPDTKTVTLTQSPSLILTKTPSLSDTVVPPDGVVNPGDTITYTFTVQNTGNVTITNINVTDPLLPGLTCNTASLAPGATQSCSPTNNVYTLTQTDINSGSRANTATATGKDPGGNDVSDADTRTTALPSSSAITLLKTGTLNDNDGRPGLSAGDTISYAFTVTNSGNVTLSNITLADTVGGVTISGGPIASLVSGASDSTTFTGSYTLTQADINAGTFTNTASVTGTPPTGPAVTDSDDDTQTLSGSPSLNIVKEVSADNITWNDTSVTVNVGDTVYYRVRVENTGNLTLTGLTVDDGMAGCTLSRGTDLTGNNDNLFEVSEEWVYTCSIMAVAGTNNNTATADSNETTPDSDSASYIATAASIADPALSKAGDPTQAAVGETVTFTLTVTNTGTAPASNVVITDPLPAMFDVTDVTVREAPTGGASVNVTPPIGTGPAPYTVVVTLNGDLTATDVVTITIVTTVNSQGNPPINNTATLTTSSQTDIVSNNADTVSITLRAPRLRLPATGFAPNVETRIPLQPESLKYAATDVVLEIPSLGVKIPIVGVPKKNGIWNVTWLEKQAGWLEGSAFPSWSGNSVLTSHVYLASGLPGPFVNLKELKFGDKIVVHAYGQKYIFEVQTNEIVTANDQSVMKHEDKSWLTLITCKDYDEKTRSYKSRVVVRAVLVKVSWE